ncbi:aminotransferase class I/II-fold pyridoxal phosphate-dependent enzyme [Brachybacterium alimentarium]|uniref:aminotransferase class I/II-fold pyridoxal phosphate-dependent enzyme n=1 Tax=Brachybacterium alimentarium TaxID=47845 RepID=UPI000DF2022B|nr:aminotransferase class I/II-fold pyridoxal phosphate-dependent enzyme [Brachybacterium alimentarium]RCS81486.1 aminotransferase class I/II-fold pyridoxal phosphate-dependent enzyme [Brachybacterium alimentarium]RCS86495.1 aminotransferase class I/II-fold pyridoxal phosphate-dependent enzyme [Brachybacterium alimentarium]
MSTDNAPGISGSTAVEIADSVRALVDRGELAPGDLLPPVRALAEQLGINRNTAVAAYRHLARSGVVVSQGRAGTRIAQRAAVAQEGFAAAGSLRDVGTGNPDPQLIPDLGPALAAAGGRPVLYGEPVIDRDLERWARDWMAADAPAAVEDVRLTLTSGAVDAVERLLAQALQRDDAVALEDPCFLASIHLSRIGGYRAVPVPVDAEGMTVDGLRHALDQGVRAVVSTPRAQNPTGASLSARRAEQLRDVLAEHPYVLVIQDDYYSFLSQQPFHSIIGPEHRRWALVRSVSKFVGPDMCLAVTATDPDTAGRLALRLSPGTTWVSHLLQRITHAVMAAPESLELIHRAGAHYAERNAAFAARLTALGLPVEAGDGMSLWVPVPVPAREVADRLMRRGWLVRTGDEFCLVATGAPSHHLRLTVHDLSEADARSLAADVAGAADIPAFAGVAGTVRSPA